MNCGNISYCVGKLWHITSCVFLIFFISCSSNKPNKAMKIFHLKPNRIIENNITDINESWFQKEREDFFVLQNYDPANEKHKAEMDSFVIDYVKKEDFFNENDNASWSLVFYKYGDGITENTPHQFDTDYYIHQLFDFKKRLAYYYFTSQNGYENTGYYINEGAKIVEEKRKALSEQTL